MLKQLKKLARPFAFATIIVAAAVAFIAVGNGLSVAARWPHPAAALVASIASIAVLLGGCEAFEAVTDRWERRGQ